MEVVETLQYIGPNRRGDFTCLEKHIVLDDDEREAFSRSLPDLGSALQSRLLALGVEAGLPEPPGFEAGRVMSDFAAVYCSIALALQKAGGHRVGAYGHSLDSVSGGVWAWFEFEHDQLAQPASELGMRIISQVVPGLAVELPEEEDSLGGLTLEQAVAQFLEKARPLVLPRDTEAIIAAARRLNIPVERLERMPFNSPSREIRIRRNGLLRLGHGPYQLEVDGTLCTSLGEQLLPMISKRRAQLGNTPASAVRGKTHQVLVAGGKVLTMIVEGSETPVDQIHSETISAAEQLAQKAQVGLLLLYIETPDISRPLAATGGVVADLDMAPELEKTLSPDSKSYRRAFESFLRWMFPGDTPCRVPIIAVTGTNGKTTTCRMITRVAQEAGKQTGLSCTEGVYVGSEHLGGYRDIGGAAFHLLLDRTDVDFVVFEEWFGRICRTGFAYVHSDVAVCMNVTNDHLGNIGTHTVEEMANVKETVVARGREAVVLNADDPLCLAMAPRMTARKICLVSSSGNDVLSHSVPDKNLCFCVVEELDGNQWIVVHDNCQVFPVIAIDNIPATFNGLATFNVSNAVHAVAACYLARLPLASIRQGLSSFSMKFENTPGRLNFFDELPYRVIMDYAHNYDGYQNMLAFVDQVPCKGRRILLSSFTGDRREEDVIEGAGLLAGHFDHYICRNYTIGRGQPLEQIPAQQKRGLMKAGVDETAITIVEDADEGIAHCLDTAQPGDLVVILAGTSEFEKIWDILKRRSQAA